MLMMYVPSLLVFLSLLSVYVPSLLVFLSLLSVLTYWYHLLLQVQFQDFLERNYLNQQVETIKEISDHVTNLKRVGEGLGEYLFDKETLGCGEHLKLEHCMRSTSIKWETCTITELARMITLVQ